MGIEDWREHESSLRLAFNQGRDEYGPLPLPFESFARRVVELGRRRLRIYRLPETRESMAGYLAGAAGADLFLAVACDEGVAGAWETFTRRYIPRLFGVARRFGASRSEAEEIARNLPGDIVAPPREGPFRTRLGAFDGTGSLLAWLSVQVVRRLADRARARHPIPMEADPGEGLSEAERMPDLSRTAADPAEVFVEAETTSRFEEALRAAWKLLEAREARALALRFREGLPLKEIAPRLGVSLAHASRIVTAGVEKVRAAVRRHLQEQFPARPEEGDRLWNTLRDALSRHMKTPALTTDPPSREAPRHEPPL